mgnify:CR=1 FL=1
MFFNGVVRHKCIKVKDIHNDNIGIIHKRKHSLEEYWNQGLNKVWSTKIVQFLVSKMVSISEMNEITNVISDINMDSVLYIDLIDNDLNDMTVIKDIVDKIKHYSK